MQQQFKAQTGGPSTGQKFKQKIDTNVFQISMACLKESAYELATGDPVACTSCHGYLNFFSII
jgi:hypothetical protein